MRAILSSDAVRATSLRKVAAVIAARRSEMKIYSETDGDRSTICRSQDHRDRHRSARGHRDLAAWLKHLENRSRNAPGHDDPMATCDFTYGGN